MDKRIRILGSDVNCFTMEETVDYIIDSIKKKTTIQHVVINASKINMMQKNNNLKDVVNNCEIINADGQSIVWAAKALGYSIPERVAGIDLFERLVSECAARKLKPYFFGAEQGIVEKVVKHYKRLYPELQVAGFKNGYFNESDSKLIADEINSTNADMLFVAFSSPKKEFWIDRYIKDIPFSMGVGGSFDVIAGKTKRAPKWMQKIGLEWFYRFIQEPKRMFKRYILGNISFILLVVRERLKLIEK